MNNSGRASELTQTKVPPHLTNMKEMKKAAKYYFLMLAFFIAAGSSTPARAQLDALKGAPPATDAPATTAPILVDKRPIFQISATPDLTAQDRAAQANLEIQNLVEGSADVPPDSLIVRHEKGLPIIVLGGRDILTVTQSDARAFTSGKDDLAQLWGNKLALEVSDARKSNSNPLSGIGILVRKSFLDLFKSGIEWLPRLISALVLLVFFWLLAKGGHWMAKTATRRSFLSPNVKQIVNSLTVYFLWALGLLATLSALGFNSSSIMAAVGVSGFVLGFALKDLLEHFLAGLILLIGQQFHIGDQIVVDDFEGTVERIDLRALHLRTYDNRLVMIPNGNVLTSAVISNTDQSYRRRDFTVGIVYSANISDATELALKIVKATPGVLADPEPDVLVEELGASSINLRVRFYTQSRRRDFLTVGSECIRRVKEAFDEADILIPNDIRMITFFDLEQVEELMARYLPRQDGKVPANEHAGVLPRGGRKPVD